MPLQDIQNPHRIIKIYHGSNILDIKHFDISKSRKSFLDFGRGIYFTTNEEQAMLWSIKKQDYGAVYEIEIDASKFSIKQYLTYSDAFINTFCFCRSGHEEDVPDIKNVDIVYGYVIDNNRAEIVKKTNDYFLGKADARDVRANIKVFDNKDQLCIKNQDVLDSIKMKEVRFTEYAGNYSRNDRRGVKWKK